jgi:carboxymethylenebutenolidase
MDQVYLQQLVRARQVGSMGRREFLIKASAALGSLAAANTLLAACAPTADEETLPPVVDETQPTAVPGTTTAGELTTGIVTYPNVDRTELMGYMAHQTAPASQPGVIVIQEWWGLNDHIKEVADRFAGEGFAALAPDLYRGVVTTEPDEARKLAMELGARDAVAEIEQAIAYLKSQPFLNGSVGVVGFCMGGGLALQTAANSDAPDAAVAFYGSPLSPAEAQNVTVPVLTFLGSADSIPVSGLEAMHAAFDEAGVENAYLVYEGAQHAFFNGTRASYDAEAAADAWQRTLAWFNTHLHGSS